eukprot:TRINITY_DN860_c0_g2_i6.p1 TRINITY_DN860_c0_g2~~TRINITY_DN860_c0_g2_i6.p1  ORF type:complete len:127 (-),score=21.41 TRINITY_DN860_c0_g2_i6:282-662(-)
METSNGITLVGRRDKFLSVKWEPVKDAVAYAVYKEVRDIWDLQTIAEAPKETLGALRPGNTYIVQVIALDSANCRLAILGPSTFRTDGPVDTRQAKVNEAKLQASWNEIIAQYPEAAGKADPYSGM